MFGMILLKYNLDINHICLNLGIRLAKQAGYTALIILFHDEHHYLSLKQGLPLLQ